jgi:hypothetical protein
MLAKVFSCAVFGLDGAITEVAMDISRDLPIALGVLLDNDRL